MARDTWGGTGDVHPLSVKITFQLGTSICMTGFKLRDQSLTPSNPQDCATDVAVWVNTNFRTVFSLLDKFLGVDVVDMTTGESGSVSFGNVSGTLDTQAAGALPSYVQIPVSMKGELRRRYGQGRMLWPVRFEGHVDADMLSNAGVTAYQGVVDALATRYIGSGTYRLITAHGVIPPRAATPTTPARPEVPPTWYDVQALRLNRVMSFVRSRKQGVGS